MAILAREKGKGKRDNGKGQKEKALGVLRNAGDHTHHVMQIDDVAGLDASRNGFAANARQTDLTLGIVGIDEVDIQRELTVNAYRLNLCHLHRPRTFQHIVNLGTGPSYARARPRVSGIQIHASAARRKASDEIDKAVPNPCVCASVPTEKGAAALTIRPML